MDLADIILKALSLGAAAGLKPTAEQAIRDAYEGFKGLICRRFQQVDLGDIERSPGSAEPQPALLAELRAAGVHEDPEVLRGAQALLDTLGSQTSDAAEIFAVDVQDLSAALDVAIENIEGGGVRLRDVKTRGGLRISGVNTHPKR